MNVKGIRANPAPAPPLERIEITLGPNEAKVLRVILAHCDRGPVGAYVQKWWQCDIKNGEVAAFVTSLEDGIEKALYP